MGWKAVLDAGDSLEREASERFDPSATSLRAFENGWQSVDIAGEQDKLRWADTLILQFPLWWFSMPAILKGWIDRVYACGFAYGVGEHSDSHWGDRYGEGRMQGKRAMLVVTAGGWESHYAARGINGPMDDLLFPIHHGILHYPGFEVLPPFVVYRSGRIDAERFAALSEQLGRRLDDLQRAAPIPFRRQNGGDYLIPALTLRDELARSGPVSPCTWPNDLGSGLQRLRLGGLAPRAAKSWLLMCRAWSRCRIGSALSDSSNSSERTTRAPQ